MIGEGYVVEGDLFDISSRIKEIDENYFIFYSYRFRRYEIHSRAQRGNTLALVLPYDRLDARALTLVRRTRADRAAALALEIERENEKIRRKSLDGTIKRVEKEVENVYRREL